MEGGQRAERQVYLDRDVRVISRQNDVSSILSPLNQSHRKRKDLTEEQQAAARPVQLALRRDLDDRD